MNFYVNPACLSSAFTLPTAIADSHLCLAKSEHLKVIIYIFRNLSNGINTKEIAEELKITEYDVKEGLLYWADAGILLQDNAASVNMQTKEKTVLKSEKPTRLDVAKRGAGDQKIRYLLNETQMKLGRNLKTNETSTLVWLYEDEGLDVSIILLIVQYAVTHGKANMRFIEQTAVNWINQGIDSMTAAEEALQTLAEQEQAWKTVSNAFGLERRKPSVKESELSRKWIFEWKISTELLNSAYDECVNKKSKFSFPYVAKIIESWHEKGVTSPDEITEKPQTQEKENFAAFDIDLYEKMINSKD